MNLYDDIEGYNEESTPNLYDGIEGYDESYEPNLYDDIDSYDEDATPNLYDGLDESAEPNLYDDIMDESIHDVVNMNSAMKHNAIRGKHATKPDGVGGYKSTNIDLKSKRPGIASQTRSIVGKLKSGIKNKTPLFSQKEKDNFSRFASTSRHYKNESYEPYDEETEGISLSTKKLLSAGDHNSSDLNAVKPNEEYCDQYDKRFIGDGEDPETSKYNVPAILAAKTAGGAPFDQTLNNGINKASADVFHLKNLRDDEGMNG